MLLIFTISEFSLVVMSRSTENFKGRCDLYANFLLCQRTNLKRNAYVCNDRW